MNNFYYIPNVWGELDIEDAIVFPSDRDITAVRGGYDEFEVSWLVEEMAKDYYMNHDGWERSDSWMNNSRTFAVWDSDRNFIGTFDVCLEYEPTFSAWRKDE